MVGSGIVVQHCGCAVKVAVEVVGKLLLEIRALRPIFPWDFALLALCSIAAILWAGSKVH